MTADRITSALDARVPWSWLGATRIETADAGCLPDVPNFDAAKFAAAVLGEESEGSAISGEGE